MKKMILTLAIAISSLAVFAGEAEVNRKVLNAFKTEFATATEVRWAISSDYYTASFIYNEKYVFAFYDLDGGLLGVTRYMSTAELPLNLQMDLKKNINGYWVSDLFEVAKNGTTSYYITLENANTKLILKSTGGSDWSEYKSAKKS
jgi:hypothetical protein